MYISVCLLNLQIYPQKVNQLLISLNPQNLKYGLISASWLVFLLLFKFRKADTSFTKFLGQWEIFVRYL